MSPTKDKLANEAAKLSEAIGVLEDLEKDLMELSGTVISHPSVKAVRQAKERLVVHKYRAVRSAERIS